jgi:hypothetical protein
LAEEALLGNPKGKRQFGGTTHRWEDNIKNNLKETRQESVD